MKVLIDIGHPGHVHLFRCFARQLINEGWEILFTCRDKEYEKKLLESYNFNYVNLGKHKGNLLGKIFGLFKFDYKLYKIAKKFKPDIFLSHGSIYASHVAFFMKKPNVCLEDTGNKEQVMLYKPFTKYILTPSVFPDFYGKKQTKYNGYHELAYLHPQLYNPDDSVYSSLDNIERNKYVILRFVSWKATHDIGKSGISDEIAKKILILCLEKNFKVYISSEKALPYDLEKYRLNTKPEQLHDALHFAQLVVGDSQTIVAEAGILGTPAIRFNNLVGTSHGYHHQELEDMYGLIYNIHNKQEEKLFKTIDDILSNNNIKQLWKLKQDRLFKDKINVTEFLLDFIKEKVDETKSK